MPMPVDEARDVLLFVATARTVEHRRLTMIAIDDVGSKGGEFEIRAAIL